jgi:hypothetical protein
MNKRVFTVEIESFDDHKPLKDFQLFSATNMGLQDLFDMGFRVSSVKETTVEQTCGTVDFAEKAIDLLKRASDSLNSYCADANGDLNDSLATEIDCFLSGKA